MKNLLFYLVTSHGYNPAANRAVKKIIEYVSMVLLVLICLIDWDVTLANLGL